MNLAPTEAAAYEGVYLAHPPGAVSRPGGGSDQEGVSATAA